MFTTLRTGVELWGMILCLIISVFLIISFRTIGKSSKLLFHGYVFVALLFFTDNVIRILEGTIYPYSYIIMQLSAWFTCFIQYNLICLSYCIIISLIDISKGNTIQYQGNFSLYRSEYKHSTFWIFLPLCIAFLFLLATPFNGFYYLITKENLFVLSANYYVSIILRIISMLILLIFTIRRRKEMNSFHFSMVLLFILTPIVCSISIVYTKNLFPILIGNVVSLLFVTVALFHQLIEMNMKNERELVDMTNRLLLAQLNPHFIFNSLTTIRSLCRKNPETAINVIDNFSSYLQQNMKFIGTKLTVPIEEEIQALTDYTAIVNYRIPDILFQFNINDNGYEIPPMSLQPIIENAINHGIRQKLHGGTINITFTNDRGYHVIEIEDNGVGFDSSAPSKKDDRQHSIDIVSARLKNHCKGTLKTQSIPGVGTKVTIRIPSIYDK